MSDLDTEIDCILSMSEDKLRAEFLAAGRDPDQVIADMRARLEAARRACETFAESEARLVAENARLAEQLANATRDLIAADERVHALCDAAQAVIDYDGDQIKPPYFDLLLALGAEVSRARPTPPFRTEGGVKMADDLGENLYHIANYENPPGYSDTIGGVVPYDPPDAVISAACAAYWPEWDDLSETNPRFVAVHRVRMRDAIAAAVRASA